MIVANRRHNTKHVQFEVQFLAGDLEKKQLPYFFPSQFSNVRLGITYPQYDPSMLLHNGTILLCGGRMKKCYQLFRGNWMLHSTLNKSRVNYAVVSTQKAIFIFGGDHSRNTYEYLPKESTKWKWQIGKTEIPGGFQCGCAIAVKSEQEIWLIGDLFDGKKILQFNVNDHTFKLMPTQLIVEIGPYSRCALIPNSNKLMIMGSTYGGNGNIAEIVDIENESVTMTGPLMNDRNDGWLMRLEMDVFKIDGEDRIAVFSGLHGLRDQNRIIPEYLDTIELYNSHTNKWEPTNKTFNGKQRGYGFLKIKLSDIIPELRCSVDYFRSKVVAKRNTMN